MKEKDIWENFSFPKVKNIAPRTLSQDIFPYIPGDKKNMAAWNKMRKKLWSRIKKDFDKKGIPLPGIVIDSTPGPITYGVKTVDSSGNTLHSQL